MLSLVFFFSVYHSIATMIVKIIAGMYLGSKYVQQYHPISTQLLVVFVDGGVGSSSVPLPAPP
jgi:hypothetical protein